MATTSKYSSPLKVSLPGFTDQDTRWSRLINPSMMRSGLRTHTGGNVLHRRGGYWAPPIRRVDRTFHPHRMMEFLQIHNHILLRTMPWHDHGGEETPRADCSSWICLQRTRRDWATSRGSWLSLNPWKNHRCFQPRMDPSTRSSYGLVEQTKLGGGPY